MLSMRAAIRQAATNGLSALLLSILALCGLQSFCYSQRGAGPATSQDKLPESFEQLEKRAEAKMEAGENAEAIRLYEQATAIRPTWSEGWWYLGTMSFDAGEYAKARDAFEHFVSVERTQPGPGFGMLGLSEFKLHEYRRALGALERGRAFGFGSNSAFTNTALYHDAILNTYFKQPELALQRLTLVANTIASEHPEDPRGAVFADSQLIDALGLAALRLPKLPSEISGDQALLVQSAGRAQALIALQDRVAAAAEFRTLVAQYPSQPGVHYMYGVFLLKENPAQAASEFRREIEISPSSEAPRLQLAFECLRTADYTQGLKFAQDAIALAPGNFAAHVVCGRLWLGLGNTDHALAELRTGVKLSPGSPDAHFALAQALVKAGQKEDAAREFAEFQRLKALPETPDQAK